MSHNQAGDLRVRRTRKLLRDALIELTSERGFAAVGVGDIAERAMVNRATFYRHYIDKHDLVMSAIKDVLAELGLPDPQLKLELHGTGAEEPSPAVVHLFEHIRAHEAFYRALLVNDVFPSLETEIRAYVEQLMRQRLAAAGYDPEQARLPFELCINAMVSTALGMIKWWLEHRMPYTPQQMALWLPQINMRGLHHALGLDGEGETGRQAEGEKESGRRGGNRE